MGPSVYPPAPRATVGGWLATDGLAWALFEYGWLSENVLSADVVPQGWPTDTAGEELRSFRWPGENRGGWAGIWSRRRCEPAADADVPFAAASTSRRTSWAVASLHEAACRCGIWPSWTPGMVRAIGLGDCYLLFGAYPEVRASVVEEAWRETVESYTDGLCRRRELPRVGRKVLRWPFQPTPTSAQRTRITMTDARGSALATTRSLDRPRLPGTVSMVRGGPTAAFAPNKRLDATVTNARCGPRLVFASLRGKHSRNRRRRYARPGGSFRRDLHSE